MNHLCEFNFCTNVALPNATKCEFHKHRSQCIEKDCYNQVYARNRCARHGGKRKCIAQGCTSNAQGNEFCVQHGGIAVKRYCSVEGCQKQAQAGQKCLRHGGGRRCKVQDCTQYVRTAGMCHAHYSKSTMTTHYDPSICKYAYKSCPNPRAVKKDGTLHSLCESHRRKTNKVQQEYAAKKRQTIALDESILLEQLLVDDLAVDPIPYDESSDDYDMTEELRGVMDLDVVELDILVHSTSIPASTSMAPTFPPPAPISWLPKPTEIDATFSSDMLLL
ncbi:hypothetical protein LEN26_019640 [Aphanomyces euteiches]|nr:hypothetical protein LEN26_019640 [Aphanomyces euteiches]KAH9106273.1 hypothetical protein AeMF1_018083 [Aphanomyces euteiches]